MTLFRHAPPVCRHLALIVLLALPAAARASFENYAGDYTLASNVTLRGEAWIRARTLTLQGSTEDDLFALSALGASVTSTNNTPSVRLAGAMQSDVWAAGDDVELSGSVQDHARLAGLRTVHVTGSIGRNLTILAKAAHIDTGASVTGDVTVIAGDAIVEGHVNGDLSVRAQKAVLGGEIRGNVTLMAAEITVVPGTTIGGNLAYLADDDLVLDPGVKLAGKLTRLTPPVAEPPRFTLDDLALQIGLYLGALLAGLLLFSLLPTFAFHSVDRLAPSVWRSLLIGFATCALIAMTAVLLLVTLVGAPLGLMLLMVLTLMLYFGKTVAAFFLGHTLIRRLNPAAPQSLMPVLALGLTLIYVAINLPFPVDIAAWFAFTFIGIGGMASAILDRRVPVLTASPGEPPPPPAPPPLPGGGN